MHGDLNGLNEVIAAFVLGIIPVLSFWFILSGLDDLAVDCIFGWMKVFATNPLINTLPPSREKKFAVLIPLWNEYEVIEQMLTHNKAIIQYQNYDFFIGVYPNDKQTLHEIRQLEQQHPRIHLCLCPHDGPTSKADCLNWIFQHIILYEQQTGDQIEAFLTHDAEDVIHPRSFALINQLLNHYDMVQIPILPLPTSFRKLTHAVYCDEFAEGQLKDLQARVFSGGFLPSCGVGTAFSRHCIQALAETQSNRVFEPTCLTEDYEIGLRVHRLGLSQIFVRPDAYQVMTWEFFPQTFRGAVRQRTRWITGISLQGWQRNGWGNDKSCWYWLWRDRKGLIGNPLSLLANVIFVYGITTLCISLWTAQPWQLSGGIPLLAWWALGFQLIRLVTRTICCALIYGPWFALGTPLRVVWANVINSFATVSAIQRFAHSVIHKTPLIWLKTEHAFPTVEAIQNVAARAKKKATSAGAG